MIIITDLRVSVFCNVMATIFGVMALACGLAALAEDNWKIDEVTTSGLWKVCSNTACEYIVLVPSWLSAVRGIFVMMIVVLGLANVANFVSQCTMQPQTRHFSACGFGFAGFCGVIGKVVYIAMTQEEAIILYTYGLGFYLFVGSILMTLLADHFNRVSAGKMITKKAELQQAA